MKKNNGNELFHNLNQTKIKIADLTARNIALTKELKNMNQTKKVSPILQMKIEEYKTNSELLQKLRNIERVHMEAEIANLQADAIKIAKVSLKKTTKKFKEFDFEKYEDYLEEIYDCKDRMTEMYENFDALNYEEQSDELFDSLKDILATEKKESESNDFL
ncbi:hypothetical protein GVAV_001286 [Gurleya vavrai]